MLELTHLQVLMVDPTKGSSELFESIEDDDGEQARADEMSEDDKDEKEEGSEKVCVHIDMM